VLSGMVRAAPPAAALRLVSPVQPFGVFMQVAAIADKRHDGMMAMEFVTPRAPAVTSRIADSALPDVWSKNEMKSLRTH